MGNEIPLGLRIMNNEHGTWNKEYSFKCSNIEYRIFIF